MRFGSGSDSSTKTDSSTKSERPQAEIGILRRFVVEEGLRRLEANGKKDSKSTAATTSS